MAYGELEVTITLNTKSFYEELAKIEAEIKRVSELGTPANESAKMTPEITVFSSES